MSLSARALGCEILTYMCCSRIRAHLRASQRDYYFQPCPSSRGAGFSCAGGLVAAWRECGGVGWQGEGPAKRSTSEPTALMLLDAAGSTASMPDQNTASGNAILHPQDSPSNAAAPQWEPRKPWAGTRKPRWEMGTSAGLKCGCWSCWSIIGPPTSFDPSDQSRKRILWPGWRLPGAFTLPRMTAFDS